MDNVGDLPIRTVSLGSFCRTAKRLLETDRHECFAQFMLCGIHEDEQTAIEPLRNAMVAGEPFQLMRDYDSLLGISEHIMVDDAITLFPIAKREDTLSVSIHFEYEFQSDVETFVLPVHKVPNIAIGKWNVHNLIRAFIPGLWTAEGRTPFLTQEESRMFYEGGLRPAITKLCAHLAGEWPATYDDEMFRARGRNGQLAFGTKVLGKWLVPQLGDAIRASLLENGCSWGAGLVFLHQIRGVKHSTSHSPEVQPSRRALRHFLRSNCLSWKKIMEEGLWFIDVGIEVSSLYDNCLAWRTDSHPHITAAAVPGLSNHTVMRITTLGSSMYARDIVSHLPAVSGCRINTGSTRGTDNIVYLQMYTTDKALTYRPEQGHFGKFINPADILKKGATPWIENLCALYGHAAETGKGHARLEVRAELQTAADVLLELDEDLIRKSLISVPMCTWWSFRSYRAIGLKFILQWQLDGDPEHRARESALVLLACCAWLLNSLHSAPQTGASWKALMSSALHHVDRAGADSNILLFGRPSEEEEEEEEDSSDMDEGIHAFRIQERRGATMLPAAPYGVIFTRPVRLGKPYPVPRLTSDARYILNPVAFKYIFGATIDKVYTDILQKGAILPRHHNRVANKVRKLPTYYNWGQNPQGNIFSTQQLGARLPLRVQDTGSDIEEMSEPEPEPIDQTDCIDTFLTLLWYLFLTFISTTAPNQRNADQPSYTHLTEAERSVVNEMTYSNDLATYFRDCQYKRASAAEWRENFNRFFLPKGIVRAGNVQNFKKAEYYVKWETFKAKADPVSYKIASEALYKRSKKLSWLPAAESDRAWSTKVRGKGWKNLMGETPKVPAPRILIQGSAPVV